MQGQGYRRDEIATNLGVHPSTVSDYLTDARAAGWASMKADDAREQWVEHERRAEFRRALILNTYEEAKRRGDLKSILAALRQLEEHDRARRDDHVLAAGARPFPVPPEGPGSDAINALKELAAGLAQFGPISMETSDLLKQYAEPDLSSGDPSSEAIN